jgi:hypothetical protein
MPRTPSQQRHLINEESFDQPTGETPATVLDLTEQTLPNKDQIINQPHFINEDGSNKALQPIINSIISLPSAPPLGNYFLL